MNLVQDIELDNDHKRTVASWQPLIYKQISGIDFILENMSTEQFKIAMIFLFSINIYRDGLETIC